MSGTKDCVARAALAPTSAVSEAVERDGGDEDGADGDELVERRDADHDKTVGQDDGKAGSPDRAGNADAAALEKRAANDDRRDRGEAVLGVPGHGRGSEPSNIDEAGEPRECPGDQGQRDDVRLDPNARTLGGFAKGTDGEGMGAEPRIPQDGPEDQCERPGRRARAKARRRLPQCRRRTEAVAAARRCRRRW